MLFLTKKNNLDNGFKYKWVELVMQIQHLLLITKPYIVLILIAVEIKLPSQDQIFQYS